MILSGYDLTCLLFNINYEITVNPMCWTIIKYTIRICISKQISCIQYADDTTIYASGKHLSDVANMVNTELECINEWIK